MSFHLVSGADNRHRVGEFATLAEAMSSAMLRAATGKSSPAFIVEAVGTVGGRLVAGYDEELGWVEVNADEEIPDWWRKLTSSVREKLLAGPREHLTDELRDAVLRAGAPLVAAYWVAEGPETAVLEFAIAERDWLTRRSIIERF